MNAAGVTDDVIRAAQLEALTELRAAYTKGRITLNAYRVTDEAFRHTWSNP